MGKITKFGDDGEVTMKETPTSHQPEAQDDVSMADAGEEGEEGEEEYEEETEETKVRLVRETLQTNLYGDCLD